jgi:citrate lyase beta subunit
MSYFNCLDEELKKDMFYLPPTVEPLDSDREILAHALGATLYMPGNYEKAIDSLIENEIPGLVSAVLCLEDAVADNEVHLAENNLCAKLKTLSDMKINGNEYPFIFIRVRNIHQFKRITEKLESLLKVLTGFVFPKFDDLTGQLYFEHLGEVNKSLGKKLYGMPIMESSGVIYLETRGKYMLRIKEILDEYKDLVLNVRIGATDLSGLYGLRRSYELTIYDVAVIRDFISELINVFGRPGDGYVVSGPVWEYFSSGTRILKPQLRQSPFQEKFGREGQRVRHELLCRYIDGLIREIMLDKANGIIGKTIIHPSHLLPVQSLYAVTHEEYCDARDILTRSSGGVAKSAYNNKMNESKPHTNWAKKIMILSRIYGVLNEGYDYTSIIYAGEKLYSNG